MKNNKKIINSANRALAREISSIKNLKSTFNSSFCNAVNLIMLFSSDVSPEFEIAITQSSFFILPKSP